MGPTPVTLSRLRLGRLRVVRRRLLQRYEHQPLVSCLAGLYGCQWRRYQRTRAPPGGSCCNKVECASVALLVVTFGLTLVFLYFWSEAQNDYNDFDWFNFGNTGFWFPWSVVLLVIAVVLFAYISMLLMLALCLLSEGQRLYLHWAHKIGVLVTLTFAIVATAVLSDLWSGEWSTLLLSFQLNYGPGQWGQSPRTAGGPQSTTGSHGTLPPCGRSLNDDSFVLANSVAFLPHDRQSTITKALFCARNPYDTVTRAAVLGLFLALLLALYLVPLGMYSPCIKEKGTLGPAPTLIGHRGAPMLAPENTQMSFEKAVELGVLGLETDVTISYDGVPFLMHDRTLRRTTNVWEVFPNRTEEPAAMFSWSELEQLNAGAWFLSRDPFGTASSLDAADRARAQNQSVCTLRAFLDLAAQHGRLVIFDLYRPPRGHPYRDTWISRTLEVIHNESSIRSNQVLWLAPELREQVQELDPELQQISGSRALVEELQNKEITRLNLHYSSMSQEQISNYAAANISTNLYVVSQPWLYSLAWCAGAHSVTTNAPQVLRDLLHPLFLMTPEKYRLMWLLTDVVSAVLIFVFFSFHWWRERRLAFCTGSRQTQENGLYSKFRTEMSDVWSISSVHAHAEGRSPPVTPNLSVISEVQEPAL